MSESRIIHNYFASLVDWMQQDRQNRKLLQSNREHLLYFEQLNNTTMSNVTKVNPKALIGGVINSDNEILTLEDMNTFLNECAACIGDQFMQHGRVKALSFSYYLKDGLQQFNEAEVKKLDDMMFICEQLCVELHEDLPTLIQDAIQETSGLMTEHDVKCAIAEIVGQTIDLTEVKSVGDDNGINTITMSNGDQYFIMVSKYEEEIEP